MCAIGPIHQEFLLAGSIQSSARLARRCGVIERSQAEKFLTIFFRRCSAHPAEHPRIKSFQWLERAYNQRDPGLPSIKVDPLLKNLRHDPRYIEFVKKMRLPT